MRNLLFLIVFLCVVLFLSQITNWRIKKIASSTSNVSINGKKCVFSRTFIFLFHEKKKDNGAQHLRNTLGSHD